MKGSNFLRPVALVLAVSLLCFSSCQKSEQQYVFTGEVPEGTALNGNAANGGVVEKVDDCLIAFGNGPTAPIFYSIDLANDSCTPNCGDPVCLHDSYKCSAYISPRRLSPMLPQKDGFLIADPANVYHMGLESKETVAFGDYNPLEAQGISNCLVDDKVVYFTAEKTLMVKNYQTDEIVATFEDSECSRYGTGNFMYYEGYLYFCRNDAQLVRANLETGGEPEVVVPSKAYHIMIYDDMLYYTNTSNKRVMRANLDGSNAQKVVDRAQSFNIKDGRIYYSPEAGPEIFSCDLNGQDIVQLTRYGDFPDMVTGIYLFDDCDRLAFGTYDYSKIYTVALDGGDWKVYEFEQ